MHTEYLFTSMHALFIKIMHIISMHALFIKNAFSIILICPVKVKRY